LRFFSFGGYGLELAALALVVFGAIECPPRKSLAMLGSKLCSSQRGEEQRGKTAELAERVKLRWGRPYCPLSYLLSWRPSNDADFIRTEFLRLPGQVRTLRLKPKSLFNYDIKTKKKQKQKK